ncbi:hypothetical protein BGW80DRAFT_1247761 [Lactifluus volemus]|nr:hypothetical protein BGW80DRAFT_1247761 [Lactifluus volemus]
MSTGLPLARSLIPSLCPSNREQRNVSQSMMIAVVEEGNTCVIRHSTSLDWPERHVVGLLQQGAIWADPPPFLLSSGHDYQGFATVFRLQNTEDRRARVAPFTIWYSVTSRATLLPLLNPIYGYRKRARAQLETIFTPEGPVLVGVARRPAMEHCTGVENRIASKVFALVRIRSGPPCNVGFKAWLLSIGAWLLPDLVYTVNA